MTGQGFWDAVYIEFLRAFLGAEKNPDERTLNRARHFADESVARREESRAKLKRIKAAPPRTHVIPLVVSRSGLRCDMHNDLRKEYERLGSPEDKTEYTAQEIALIRECSGHGRCKRCRRAVFLGSDAFRTDEEDKEMRETMTWAEMETGVAWGIPPVKRCQKKR